VTVNIFPSGPLPSGRGGGSVLSTARPLPSSGDGHAAGLDLAGRLETSRRSGFGTRGPGPVRPVRSRRRGGNKGRSLADCSAGRERAAQQAPPRRFRAPGSASGSMVASQLWPSFASGSVDHAHSLGPSVSNDGTQGQEDRRASLFDVFHSSDSGKRPGGMRHEERPHATG